MDRTMATDSKDEIPQRNTLSSAKPGTLSEAGDVGDDSMLRNLAFTLRNIGEDLDSNYDADNLHTLRTDNVPLGKSLTSTTIRGLQVLFLKVFGKIKFLTKDIIEVEDEVKEGQKLTLRTSMQTITSGNVEQKQFDPNFFSREKIWCRYPGCKQRKPRQRESHGKPPKEDLYLCSRHRSSLEDYITRMCAQEGVDIAKEKTCKEDLEGYTAIIGLLENFYTRSTIKSPLVLTLDISILLKEVCLNMRNYLIIVNALLNPDDDNAEVAVNPVMRILNCFIQILGDREYGAAALVALNGLVYLLRKVMEIILFSFGIIYSWVYLTVNSLNPGAQLGVGVGGLFAIWRIGFSASWSDLLLASFIGGVFGGFIGSGLYNCACRIFGSKDEGIDEYQKFIKATRTEEEAVEDQQEIAPEEERPVYSAKGNSMGDLTLEVLRSFMLEAE